MSLKASIEGQLKVPTRIRMGRPGALDVFVDSEKVYSKRHSDPLPTPDKIIELIRARA